MSKYIQIYVWLIWINDNNAIIINNNINKTVLRAVILSAWLICAVSVYGKFKATLACLFRVIYSLQKEQFPVAVDFDW